MSSIFDIIHRYGIKKIYFCMLKKVNGNIMLLKIRMHLAESDKNVPSVLSWTQNIPRSDSKPQLEMKIVLFNWKWVSYAFLNVYVSTSYNNVLSKTNPCRYEKPMYNWYQKCKSEMFFTVNCYEGLNFH